MNESVRIAIDWSTHEVPNKLISGSEVLRLAGRSGDGWLAVIVWDRGERTRLMSDATVNPGNRYIKRFETVRLQNIDEYGRQRPSPG